MPVEHALEPTVSRVAEIEVSPAFHDLDPMDVVWHGNTLKYLELARCALLQSFDYDYPQMRESGYVWPIVDLRCKYVRSARYGQRLRVDGRAEVGAGDGGSAVAERQRGLGESLVDRVGRGAGRLQPHGNARDGRAGCDQHERRGDGAGGDERDRHADPEPEALPRLLGGGLGRCPLHGRRLRGGLRRGRLLRGGRQRARRRVRRAFGVGLRCHISHEQPPGSAPVRRVSCEGAAGAVPLHAGPSYAIRLRRDRGKRGSRRIRGRRRLMSAV